MDMSIVVGCLTHFVEEINSMIRMGHGRVTIGQKAGAIKIMTNPGHLREYIQGKRDTEYKLYGDQWNETNCYIGCPVVLVSKIDPSKRMYARIIGFRKRRLDDSTGKKDFLAIHGPNYGSEVPIAEIRIKKA